MWYQIPVEGMQWIIVVHDLELRPRGLWRSWPNIPRMNSNLAMQTIFHSKVLTKKKKKEKNFNKLLGISGFDNCFVSNFQQGVIVNCCQATILKKI